MTLVTIYDEDLYENTHLVIRVTSIRWHTLFAMTGEAEREREREERLRFTRVISQWVTGLLHGRTTGKSMILLTYHVIIAANKTSIRSKSFYHRCHLHSWCNIYVSLWYFETWQVTCHDERDKIWHFLFNLSFILVYTLLKFYNLRS